MNKKLIKKEEFKTQLKFYLNEIIKINDKEGSKVTLAENNFYNTSGSVVLLSERPISKIKI